VVTFIPIGDFSDSKDAQKHEHKHLSINILYLPHQDVIDFQESLFSEKSQACDLRENQKQGIRKD
jgi:hypothetical protein